MNSFKALELFVTSEKVTRAIQYSRIGDPWKDAMDDKDIKELLLLLGDAFAIKDGEA